MNTKKCPMCAEHIPLEATICEYCGTKFEVTVGEGRTVSKFLDEPVALQTPPPQPIPSPKIAPAPKQGSPWGWITIVLGLVLIIVVAGGGILISQNGLPFLATPTNTPRPTNTKQPTSTPDRIATQQRRNADATATSKASWAQGFAHPILNDVHDRQPNFEDDFSVLSGRFQRWSYLSGDVEFAEGIMRINTTGQDGGEAGGALIATDFVLEFEFTPRLAREGSAMAVGFRWSEPGGYGFNINLIDPWWGMILIPKEQEGRIIKDGDAEKSGLNRTTYVTVIAQGSRFAFYVNSKPFAYVEDVAFGGDWSSIGVWSPNGPAEVDFDNVKFWDLNNLLP